MIRTLSQMLLGPYTMFLGTGFERETSEGFEKSAPVGGHPGWQRWDRETRIGEVNAVVGKRFVVTAEGIGIDGTGVLESMVGRMDLAALEALK